MRDEVSFFTLKAPYGDHDEGMLACAESWASDGQDGMSIKATRSGAICEYRRRLRECVSMKQSAFNYGGAADRRHEGLSGNSGNREEREYEFNQFYP